MSYERCCKRLAYLACTLGLLTSTWITVGRAAESAGELIADYAAYRDVDFLSVSSGTVKAKKLTQKGWHVVIELPRAEAPQRVTLTAEGWDFMRLLALRGGGRLARPGNSIELTIPADGIALAARRILVNHFRDDPDHQAVHAFNETARDALGTVPHGPKIKETLHANDARYSALIDVPVAAECPSANGRRAASGDR